MDLLRVTAHELQAQLLSGRITSTQLIRKYIEQINTYDGYLNAVLHISQTALDQAAILDDERSSGKMRSPLHGIPILIKVRVSLPLKSPLGRVGIVTGVRIGQYKHPS